MEERKVYKHIPQFHVVVTSVYCSREESFSIITNGTNNTFDFGEIDLFIANWTKWPNDIWDQNLKSGICLKYSASNGIHFWKLQCTYLEFLYDIVSLKFSWYVAYWNLLKKLTRFWNNRMSQPCLQFWKQNFQIDGVTAVIYMCDNMNDLQRMWGKNWILKIVQTEDGWFRPVWIHKTDWKRQLWWSDTPKAQKR